MCVCVVVWFNLTSLYLFIFLLRFHLGVGCGSVIGDWYAGGKAVRVRRVIVAAATAVCLGVALLAWSPHIVFYLAGNVLRTSGTALPKTLSGGAVCL